MKKAFAALLILSMLLGAVAVAEAAGAAGTWYMIEMNNDGQVINPAELGMTVALELAEDGTATMSGMGGEEAQTGTWTIDGTTVTVTIDGDPLDFALEDGKLTASDDTMTMVFSQEQPEVEAFVPAAAVEAAVEDFAGTWNAVKIGLEGQYYDVSILGADVTATIEDTTITLDGFMFSNQSLSLEYADGALSFSGSSEALEMSIKASMLEDGMVALDLAANGQAFTFYLSRAEEAAEEAPAA